MAESEKGVQGRPSPTAIGITVGVVVLVFVLTWITALRRPFIDDDWSYLNTVQQPGWWHSSAVWDPHNGLYRPILYLWFGLLHLFFGLHSFAFHVATLAAVFLMGFLTWRVARAAGLRRGALVAGAVVLLHAAVGYPISWTAAASSPIAVSFALGAILVLLNRPVTLSRAFVAAALLALGLLTREVVIMAPAMVVVIGWAKPGGRLKDALRRSLPLWVVDIAYLALRAGSGASDPPGLYHEQVSSRAVNNFFSLTLKASDVAGVSAQTRSLVIAGLVLFMVGVLAWSLSRRQYILVGGLVWFVIATVPVICLVNHAMESYYIDFALPGLALAFGAACEMVVEALPGSFAILAGLVLLVTLGLVGHAVSNIEFTHEYGSDTKETQQLLAQARKKDSHPTGPTFIVVRTALTGADARAVIQGGDLFKVEFHDPALRVLVLPPLSSSSRQRP